jgi:hypothetical protein
MHANILRDLKARLAMSFKPKTIAFSAAALLAVVGGAYAFMPGYQDRPANVGEVAGSAQAAEKPEVAGTSNGQSGEGADARAAGTVVAKQPSAKNQTVDQAPKKLTRKQLTPPPPTEEEKLQKAAEQESNF